MAAIEREIREQVGDVSIWTFDVGQFLQDPMENTERYRSYLLNHLEELENIYNKLADERSQQTLLDVVRGWLTADLWYFIHSYVPDQYFPADVIRLNDHETIVECGSNNGDTLKDIVQVTGGHFHKIICFEPNIDCIRQLKDAIRQCPQPIELIEKGVGNAVEQMYFKDAGSSSKIATKEDHDYMIEVTTLDAEIQEDVSYIKMDIEGAELAALQGGENLIRKCSPLLAVCVYHKMSDIFNIARYLWQLQPDYQLYLRHHTCGAGETVLYAVLPERSIEVGSSLPEDLTRGREDEKQSGGRHGTG